jgi:hypothetical protein
MALTNSDLLEKVKIGLKADDSDYNDPDLLIKTIGVKQYMINAGISEEQIETELGIATLTIGVNDIWGLTPGDLKFSAIFNTFLIQLTSKSIVVTE